MDDTKSKKARQFLKLYYPVRIVMQQKSFLGYYPDLPECCLQHDHLATLYEQLEILRQQYIVEHIMANAALPLPNSYLHHLPTKPKDDAVSPTKDKPPRKRKTRKLVKL